MGPQTDGPEWVLASLFVLGVLVVVAAAIREIRGLRDDRRKGDDGKLVRFSKKTNEELK